MAIDLSYNVDKIKTSKLLVIDTGTEEGQALKEELLNSISVDLSNASNNVVIPYRMFLKDEIQEQYPNREFWGVIETTAQWAIAIYQDSLNRMYELIWDELSEKPTANPPKIEVSGKFDCDTATATLLPAQLARGAGVGQVDYWPLGRLEFNWTLSNSEFIGDLIEGANLEIDADTFYSNFKEILRVDVPEDKFVGLPIPSHCEGIKPTEMLTTTEKGQAQSWAWPIFLGTLSGAILIGMAYYAFSDRFKTSELVNQ